MQSIMHGARQYLGSVLLAAALLGSAASTAKAANQDDRLYDSVRYYDRDHDDYHYWNASEDRAYRRYLAAKHRGYSKFHTASTRAHRDYWKWRHTNPDRD